MSQRRTFAPFKIFATILCVTFTATQAMPAWALRGEAPQPGTPTHSGLEEALGAPTSAQPLAPTPAALFGMGIDGVPPGSFLMDRVSIGGGSADDVLTPENVESRLQGDYLFIYGLTAPGGMMQVFDSPARIHWPTISFLIKSDPNNARVKRWMEVGLPELATGIKEGQAAAVAAAVLRRVAFCATRGEAPSLNTDYSLNEPPIDLIQFDSAIPYIESANVAAILDKEFPRENEQAPLFSGYAGGQDRLQQLLGLSWQLKRYAQFAYLFTHPQQRSRMLRIAERLEHFIQQEEEILQSRGGEITELVDAETVRRSLVILKDIAWNLRNDMLGNIEKVAELAQIDVKSADQARALPAATLRSFWALTMLFNGIDFRMETRGRDSLGLSAMLTFPNREAYKDYLRSFGLDGMARFTSRQQIPNLGHGSITVRPGYNQNGDEDPNLPVTVTFVFKVAEVIGFLGDNAAFIRKAIQEDSAFQEAMRTPMQNITFVTHSRWASAGIVSIPNTHPVDNRGQYALPQGVQSASYSAVPVGDGRIEMVMEMQGQSSHYGRSGTIIVVLNGDIDNYNREMLAANGYFPNLVEDYSKWQGPAGESRRISPDITTDTKLIPLRIEHYVVLGYSLQEAVRRAARDFNGSFAFQVQSDLEPGKLYLAANGSGQGLYIGISPDGFHPASETYGFIDLTQEFYPVASGQLVTIDQGAAPKIENLQVIRFDGTPVPLTGKDVKRTTQTTRDIFLPPGYNRFFSWEVASAADMAFATMTGKVGIRKGGLEERETAVINLDESELPETILEALRSGKIRRIEVTAMGTAHAAGEVVGMALSQYLANSELGKGVTVNVSLAPDFNAYSLRPNMEDTLVIVISQSGKTADTNQALGAAIQRGAKALGIINARGSDAEVNLIRPARGGVLYTGTGRDIEIAVASTKAYYSQIIAGIIYAMKIAQAMGVSDEVILDDIKEMMTLPAKMKAFEQAVAANPEHPLIKAAQFYPLLKSEWSVVGSGPGLAAATEAIIKLSELCYRSFYKTSLPNLKHVNFSAESWVLILLANTHGANDFVQANAGGEIDKMLAHTLGVAVVTTEDDHRFDNWQSTVVAPDGKTSKRTIDIIRVPTTSERFAPIFLSMASHLMAYHIAEHMNTRGQEVNNALARVVQKRAELSRGGFDDEHILANQEFRGTVRDAFGKVYQGILAGTYNTGSRVDQTAQFLHLSNFLNGATHLSDAEFIMGRRMSATQILDQFELIATQMARRLTRTIDTIAHQAKYVTVGVKDSGPEAEGDVSQFVEAFRGRVDAQTLLELSHGYRTHRISGQPWTEVIPDMSDPLHKSILMAAGRDRVGLTRDVAAAIADKGISVDSSFVDGYPDPTLNGTELAIEVHVLERPFPAVQELGLAPAVLEKMAAPQAVPAAGAGLEDAQQLMRELEANVKRTPMTTIAPQPLIFVDKEGLAIGVALKEVHTPSGGALPRMFIAMNPQEEEALLNLGVKQSEIFLGYNVSGQGEARIDAAIGDVRSLAAFADAEVVRKISESQLTSEVLSELKKIMENLQLNLEDQNAGLARRIAEKVYDLFV